MARWVWTHDASGKEFHFRHPKDMSDAAQVKGIAKRMGVRAKGFDTIEDAIRDKHGYGYLEHRDD